MRINFLYTSTLYKIYKPKYLIGFSGGYDSSYYLKYICHKAKSYKFILIHYVHNQKNTLDLDIYFLLNYCIHFNITICIQKNQYNLINESKLREKRYNFFISCVLMLQIYNLILCHSLSDNIENLYFKSNCNIPSSLYLMKSFNMIVYEGHIIKIIRPMLNICRKYIIENTHPLVDDYTNYNFIYKRNLIRRYLNINNFHFKYFESIISIYNMLSTKFNKQVFQYWNPTHMRMEFLLTEKYLMNKLYLAINSLNFKINSKNIINNIYNLIYNNNYLCINKVNCVKTKDKIILNKLKYNEDIIVNKINKNHVLLKINNLITFIIISNAVIDVYMLKYPNKYCIIYTSKRYYIDLKDLHFVYFYDIDMYLLIYPSFNFNYKTKKKT